MQKFFSWLILVTCILNICIINIKCVSFLWTIYYNFYQLKLKQDLITYPHFQNNLNFNYSNILHIVMTVDTIKTCANICKFCHQYASLLLLLFAAHVTLIVLFIVYNGPMMDPEGGTVNISIQIDVKEWPIIKFTNEFEHEQFTVRTYIRL